MTADMKFHNIIGGVRAPATRYERGIDPRTHEPLWEVAVATIDDLDRAVEAATKAFATWGKTPMAERQDALEKVIKCVQDNAEEVKDLLMRETGKSRISAQVEIDDCVNSTRFYAGNKVLDDEIVFEDDTVKVVQTHAPIGPVGAIAPWNFPVILAHMKVISSLITGNPVIIKPSPFTPYATIRLVELYQEFLPPGLVQVLNGGADVGEAMTTHPGIKKISFTGGTKTGRAVMQGCAKDLKKVTLELAGNNAAIVTEDVDIKSVAGKVAVGGFFNAGQMCVATKRVYVPETIFDEFIVELEEAVKTTFKMAADPEELSYFGPVSNKMQYEVVKRIIDDCEKNKYDIRKLAEAPSQGYFLPPSIVVNPPQESVVVQQEQFGPILPIIKYKTLDEAIKLANIDNSGLGASVYCRDGAKAQAIARCIESGSVWINSPEKPHHGSYFSGWKESGFGGEFGVRGLLSYTYTQSLLISK